MLLNYTQFSFHVIGDVYVCMQVTFRYQTRLCDDDRTIIDDNRKDEKPMELIFGKKFKLEVWETCLKSMRVDEVASYIVDVSVCFKFLTVSICKYVDCALA